MLGEMQGFSVFWDDGKEDQRREKREERKPRESFPALISRPHITAATGRAVRLTSLISKAMQVQLLLLLLLRTPYSYSVLR
jgi:hypothetical protein